MNKEKRKLLEEEGNKRIDVKREGLMPINKQHSLITRAKMLGIATDMPGINRYERRKALKEAVRIERKKVYR